MIEVDVDVLKSHALPLPLHLSLYQVVFSCSNRGHTFYATITGSKTGIHLEVVFLVSLQRTLLKAHARSLGLWETHATMMIRPRYISVGITNEVMT